ncbi:DUF551 domain-containing protein [Cronobacter malonaticus]|uniref:DUF551 domain-containing protein n=1 Tax=Cronobacter malonaticus TaxID=413503 RepID=UPI001DF125E9|nr:DUF551 domain-containing protein [Cronobacter malonaticus]EGT4415630.1 DUF551 domain-containing protein [Cronobacter malonaticus]ELY6326594.1 DUF551 domain-containing protein [Cronobacter malonaticus]ELY6418712.1 DUF551 domain-containing protein [Cronobacter malonaticus]EMD9400743.1 DUF551 domain-containing protein [Cronobacter malonaticus]
MTFTKEQLIAAAHGRIDFANMMLSDNPEPLKERTWSIELELARIALSALREREEPVAVLDIQSGRQDGKKFALVFTRAAHTLPDDVYNLYTAPPAPVAAGWIACSERMPKIGDEIFYYCEDDGMRDCGIVGSSNFTGRGDSELFVHSEGFDLHLGADITHWMPLPAAPGKEG